MKYALRALRWAIIILWLCFASLIFTVVYSILNINVELGEAQTFIENGNIIWATPIVIKNAGLYDIYDLNMTTVIMDVNGTILIRNSSFVDVIPKERESRIWHNISISIEEITNYQSYLFQDSNFTLLQAIGLNFAKILPFTASSNLTVPWGAPLYNFSVSEPSFEVVNATHSKAALNVSFENHSFYIHLIGTIKIEILNENGVTIGEIYESIDVPTNSSYNKRIEVLVKVDEITPSGIIKITFETSTFSFGPLVIAYGI